MLDGGNVNDTSVIECTSIMKCIMNKTKSLSDSQPDLFADPTEPRGDTIEEIFLKMNSAIKRQIC
jgi:hypothetical protein